ncbi:MAG: spore cortex-lytic enzyme [Oscillospiraceae bacterium]|jgi:N-acetylmuramoyl-L-alanine amidase
MDRRKRVLALAVVFALNILVILLAESASAATFKQGSTGSTVTQIQQRLINWGYLSGWADGVYGSKTRAAVVKFQRKNGLKVDGICGPETLAALGISVTSGGSQRNEVNLLARLISAEARGEPYSGMVAVGAVVLNRVDHPSFPNTLAGVIYQKGAFTCIEDGQWDQPVSDSAYQAAREALNGSDPSGGAIYYYNPNKASNQWIRSRPVITTIGSHLFCA